MERVVAAGDVLKVHCTANQGLRTGDNDKYLSSQKNGDFWKPAIGGKHVERYGAVRPEIFVLYDTALLDAPRRAEIFETSPKIVVQEIRNISLPRRIIATLDTDRTYCLQSTNVMNLRETSPLDLRFILGILNSTLINFFFRCSFPGNNHIPSNQLLRIPIVTGSDAQQGKLVSFVQRMLDLRKWFQVAGTDHERGFLQRQISATDAEIDRLVYELYGLTSDEIGIVETNT